jgi:hypothetical protein
MAEGRGGYRQPSNPAPVSGPGSLSRRTDGQGARYMAGGDYGEGQEMMDLQTSAPMSKTETTAVRPRARAGRQAAPEAAMPTPLFAPTERPDEPITAGAPFGPGPGPAPRSAPSRSFTSTLEKLLPYDQDGSIARLLSVAQRRGW